MRTILALFLCVSAAAQTNPTPLPTIAITGPSGMVYPGQAVPLNITLSGSGSLNLASLGFTILPAGTTFVVGPASTAAQKTLWQGPAALLLTGLTNTASPTVSNLTYSDGVIMTATYTVPATALIGSVIQVNIPSVMAANITGASVTLNTQGASLTVGYNSACVTDAQALVAAFIANPSITNFTAIQPYLASILKGTCVA